MIELASISSNYGGVLSVNFCKHEYNYPRAFWTSSKLINECRWRTIPPYVLEKGDIAEQYILGRAMDSCDLHKLKAAEVGEFTAKDVIHLEVQPDSQHCKVVTVFASGFVAQSIFDQLWSTESVNILVWVSAGTKSSELGALQGIFWEQARHQTICRGVTFAVREAADSTHTEKASFPPSTLINVDDWSQTVQASAETYC